MNVYCASNCKPGIKKKVFHLKPTNKDGLLLQIHHTINIKGREKCIRFIYSAFDISGMIVASADINGNIFVVDFSTEKFWSLPKFSSCSVLTFTPVEGNVMIGTNDCKLYILDIHTGIVRGILLGHNYPVKSISFDGDQCLTASVSEAIIFNIKTCTKIHQLTIESPQTLKQISFTPISHHIIACFSDDYIHVWKSKTFESYKKLLPSEWDHFFVKSIAVTRNGTTMVIAGISSKLVIFTLDSWSLTKVCSLPNNIIVKSVDFISLPHDGGANKYLIILATNGVVHILDMENNFFTSSIQLCSEIISFSYSSNGFYLACVLKSGEVNIYRLSQLLESHFTDIKTCHNQNKKKTKLYVPAPKRVEKLDLNKLQGILKEFGEYPKAYRSLIWSKILLLPNNAKSFESIVKKGYNKCFSSVENHYPMINKSMLENLKRTLSNLANWCNLFCYIEFLPVFVFPFIHIFEYDPVLRFEGIVTILINWCQHWFECTPFAPVNILTMIENMLSEHDPQLLTYLITMKITTHVYAWPMLETAFSEILSNEEWCVLWDHILSNEPAFLLMIPVAYNILCRGTLAMLSIEDFELFYRSQNSIEIQKLVSKAYYLLNNTSERNHPRQYLNSFVKIPSGSYPIFEEFSNVSLEYCDPQLQELKNAEEDLVEIQTEIIKYKEEQTGNETNSEFNKQTAKQLQMLENMYQDKFLKEREKINERKHMISKLKTQLRDLQSESITVSRKRLEENNYNTRKRELNKMMKSIEYNQMEDEHDIQKTENTLSKHYVELLRDNVILENMIINSTVDETRKSYNDIKLQRQKLRKELEEIKKAMKSLHKNVSPSSKNYEQLAKMENDTKELENDVQNLLDNFPKTNRNEFKSHSNTSATEPMSSKTDLDTDEQSEVRYVKQKKNRLNRNKPSTSKSNPVQRHCCNCKYAGTKGGRNMSSSRLRSVKHLSE